MRLVQSSNVPVKAIYVQRENSADLTSIPNGTYSAMIETGNSWSGKTLKFLDSNRAPELVGKFVFYEVESAQGSIGCTFTIVLRTNPSTGHAQTHLD